MDSSKDRDLQSFALHQPLLLSDPKFHFPLVETSTFVHLPFCCCCFFVVVVFHLRGVAGDGPETKLSRVLLKESVLNVCCKMPVQVYLVSKLNSC